MASKVVHLAALAQDISSDNFPSVTYIDPNGFLPDSLKISEHPPGDVTVGQNWTAAVIESIMASPIWPSCVIFLTWDESGGFYDHLPPPQVDEWGYGFRVPMIIISPFSRRDFVDHEVMDHTSILKFIDENWNLPALTPREENANDMMSAFVFHDGGMKKVNGARPAGPPTTRVELSSLEAFAQDSALIKEAARVRLNRDQLST